MIHGKLFLISKCLENISLKCLARPKFSKTMRRKIMDGIRIIRKIKLNQIV